MEPNSHYLRTGLFVIIFTMIFIIFCIWLSVGLSGKTYDTYQVYMRESVSGLSDKAPVKYNGVEVGYVSGIALYEKNPQLVTLTLSIDSEVAVYADTRAVLETQGLTGIAYIELKGGHVGTPLLTAKKNQKYPVIQAAPSLLFRLDNALDDITHNLNDISDGLRNILNPENTEAIQDMIENFKKMSDDLQRNSGKLDLIIDNTAEASKDLPDVMKSVQNGAESIENIANKLSNASNDASQAMQTMSATMLNINNQVLPQVQTSMSDFQATMSNLKRFSNQLDDNPSILVRGKQPAQPGPGE